MDDVERSIAHAVGQLHRRGTVIDTLELVVRSAAEALPAFDHLGISTLERDGSMVTRVSTSVLVLELDELQYALREGPAFECLAGEHVVRAPETIATPHVVAVGGRSVLSRADSGDTRADGGRWPRYTPGAAGHGVRSQLAVRLHTDRFETIGGFNLYSTTQDVVTDVDVTTATYFAVQATAALVRARGRVTLAEVARRRQVTSQAVGVLMERYRIDERSAHAFLWRASTHLDVQVRVMAETLVAEANNQGVVRP